MDLRGTDLREANLNRADLGGANLNLARLAGANLSGANLEGSSLRRASLASSDLTMANLCSADLTMADLYGADLTDVDLTNADFRVARLSWTRMHRTKLMNSRCGKTTFDALDLSSAIGLETIDHFQPSTIGIDTLYMSGGKISEVFLRSCGVPEELIRYLPSLLGTPLDFYTCFISYAERDGLFSERLYNDLQAKGVRCWRWREDAKWGRSLMGEVDSAIRIYDKLIVICSESSLRSEPMVREIERALQKERRGGKGVLFPIRLDDHVFGWKHELQADVVRKNVGDFRKWTNPAAYEKALTRLIRDLKAKPVTGAKP